MNAATTPSVPAVQQPKPVLIAHGESWWDDSAKFDMIQRSARMFASSPLVPEQFRGPDGLGSCVIALNMAQRMGADPLMVMQNLYVVHGRPSWSAQFLIACFNQTGRFTPLRYTWSGTEGKDDWSCQAWSTDRETGERIEGPAISIKMAKDEKWYDKSGSKWKTIPRLMLMYRAASWLVRTHAPEIAMGLRTQDEEVDAYEPSPQGTLPVNGVNGSRTNRVAELLGGDAPVIETTLNGSLTMLAHSIGQRITDAENQTDVDMIRAEIDEANRAQLLPLGTVSSLNKSLREREAAIKGEPLPTDKAPAGQLV